MLDLRPRLHSIAELVPHGAQLADIGTDHAYLPVYLLKQNRISHAIASDLREGPLSRGRAVARQWEIPEEQISFRCSDGLSGLVRGEADTIVIAGMGGDTIANCLEGVSWSRDPELWYLLQPMSSIPELRLWLSEHAFCIEEEYLSREEEKLYVVLKVRPGFMSALTLGECWAGRQWSGMRGEHRLSYLDDLIVRRERALSGMKKARAKSLEQDIKQVELLLQELCAMREEWLSWQA